MCENSDMYKRMSALYADGDVPWDEALPPPEVLEFLPGLSPGRALDLGCGLGRASIYMAELGWEVDAVDFIPEAIVEATARASKAGLEVRFHQSPIPELDFLSGPYDFALDVGCGHNFDNEGLQQYEAQLRRLIRPGGHFMMFARVRNEEEAAAADGPSGLVASNLLRLFAKDFVLEWQRYGETQVEDSPPWTSAWFLFRRLT